MISRATPPPSYSTVNVVNPGTSQTELKEIKLWDNSSDRRKYEDMSDLYAIIKTTDHLETAYSRDAITTKEYETACVRLISQFKSTEAALVRSGTIQDTASFIASMRMDCPRAYERLLQVGVPATVVHQSVDERNDAVHVAETVQFFITAMDALKLEQRAVDELQPLVNDVMMGLTRCQGLPQDNEAKAKLLFWLGRLNALRAVDELTDEDARQLTFDLDTAYQSFHRFLQSKGK